MIEMVTAFERFAYWIVTLSVGLATAMTCMVIVERIALARHGRERRRVELQYGPLVGRALDGDELALRALVASPVRDRVPIGRLLVVPLISNRDPARVAATRQIVLAMGIERIALRWRRSRRWWRRTVGLRALGLIQDHGHTATIVAGLDDARAEVRDAALDALADQQDPAALAAVVIRLHDGSLQRGRRAAALAAFGSQAESLLLDLSSIDPENRLNYAHALAICGTAAARPTLCAWTADGRAVVRAAAFDALAHVGIDDRAAALAIQALGGGDVAVRAAAAWALTHWAGVEAAAPQLARHLDDAWIVAVPAAQALQSMGECGRRELEASALRQDQAGALARQMLWEAQAQW
jgi:hypothetical protein